MLNPIDNYFIDKEEPIKSYLGYLRAFILGVDLNVSEEWKYGMPFYYYKGKAFAYLWIHKKFKKPYIGIVKGKQINHPDLILEKRAKMKILLLDPDKDVPIDKIEVILKEALSLYKC